MSELSKLSVEPRNMRAPLRIRKRAFQELLWIGVSIAAAFVIGANNEYGYGVVPFFSICFYLLIGIFRLIGVFARWTAR